MAITLTNKILLELRNALNTDSNQFVLDQLFQSNIRKLKVNGLAIGNKDVFLQLLSHVDIFELDSIILTNSHAVDFTVVQLVADNCLYLTECNFDGCEKVNMESMLDVFEQCTSLTHISLNSFHKELYGGMIDDSPCGVLFPLLVDEDYFRDTLRSFIIRDKMKFLTHNDIMTITYHYQLLTELSIMGEPYISPFALSHIIGRSCINLKTITCGVRITEIIIRDYDGIPVEVDKTIELLVKGCNQLTYININIVLGNEVQEGGHQIRDNTLTCIAQHLPQLKSLKLNRCLYASCVGVQELALHCKSLQQIRLLGMFDLDFKHCLAVLSQLCTTLTSITFYDAHQVAETAADLITANCNCLAEVNIYSQCSNVDVEKITDALVVYNCTQLRTINFNLGLVSNTLSMDLSLHLNIMSSLTALSQTWSTIHLLENFTCHIPDELHSDDESQLCMFFMRCTGLKTISIQLNILSDNTIIAICQNCKRVTHLIAGSSILFTDLSLHAIAEHLPRLQYLFLAEANVTYSGVVCLMDCCTELRLAEELIAQHGTFLSGLSTENMIRVRHWNDR